MGSGKSREITMLVRSSEPEHKATRINVGEVPQKNIPSEFKKMPTLGQLQSGNSPWVNAQYEGDPKVFEDLVRTGQAVIENQVADGRLFVPLSDILVKSTSLKTREAVAHQWLKYADAKFGNGARPTGLLAKARELLQRIKGQHSANRYFGVRNAIFTAVQDARMQAS